jgi:hypothetical protein
LEFLHLYNFIVFNRKELNTTDIELKTIAPAAIIGPIIVANIPKAAAGIATVL